MYHILTIVQYICNSMYNSTHYDKTKIIDGKSLFPLPMKHNSRGFNKMLYAQILTLEAFYFIRFCFIFRTKTI